MYTRNSHGCMQVQIPAVPTFIFLFHLFIYLFCGLDLFVYIPFVSSFTVFEVCHIIRHVFLMVKILYKCQNFDWCKQFKRHTLH